MQSTSAIPCTPFPQWAESWWQLAAEIGILWESPSLVHSQPSGAASISCWLLCFVWGQGHLDPTKLPWNLSGQCFAAALCQGILFSHWHFILSLLCPSELPFPHFCFQSSASSSTHGVNITFLKLLLMFPTEYDSGSPLHFGGHVLYYLKFTTLCMVTYKFSPFCLKVRCLQWDLNNKNHLAIQSLGIPRAAEKFNETHKPGDWDILGDD